MKKLLAALITLGFFASFGQPAFADWKTELLEVLTVKAESKSSTYKRTNFKHWIDADKDKCDTRAEVLLEESLEPASISKPCKVTTGKWVSQYDLKTVYVASLLDIDHMIPLKEAWESGASGWSASRRQAFANDLGFSGSLIAVTASTNRSKGDKDPTGWLPQTSQVCSYVVTWISVKYRWDLSIDSMEKTSLARALEKCPQDAVVQLPAKPGKPGSNKTIGTVGGSSSPEPSETPAPTASPSPQPTPSQTPGSSNILAGRSWTISIAGPDSVPYGQPFSLRLTVKDFDGNPLQGKVVSYTSWQFSGVTQPTDSLGNVDLEVPDPLPTGYRLAVGNMTLRVSSDYANASKTIKVESNSSPSPTPSATPTPEPSPSNSSDAGSTTYRLITPGAFCAKTEAGTYGKSSSGVIYQCKTSSTENRLRWRR